MLATVLIVLGCLLAPMAVITGWAKSTLTDTDTFVATYAPLAHDPRVQAYVVDQAATAIDQNIDIEGLTSEVIDGIKALGTRPRASAALDALKGPATQGIEDLIRDGITAFVGSDAFPQTWERALRVSHTQLVATLTNDPQALAAAQSDGTIGIQLGPIVEDVKAALLARNITVASRIPPIDRTIPIAQSDQIPTVQAGYRAIVALGGWLPWVALAFLAAGVLVARRRNLALVWAAVGLGLSMLVLLLGFTVGRAVLLTSVPATLVPGDVITLLYETAIAAMKDTAIAGLVLAAGNRGRRLAGRTLPDPPDDARLLRRRSRIPTDQRRGAGADHRPGGRVDLRAAAAAARAHRARCGRRDHPAAATVGRGHPVDTGDRRPRRDHRVPGRTSAAGGPTTGCRPGVSRLTAAKTASSSRNGAGTSAYEELGNSAYGLHAAVPLAWVVVSLRGRRSGAFTRHDTTPPTSIVTTGQRR